MKQVAEAKGIKPTLKDDVVQQRGEQAMAHSKVKVQVVRPEA